MLKVPKTIKFCIQVFERSYDVRLYNTSRHCIMKNPGLLLKWLLKGRHFGEVVGVVNGKKYLYHYFPIELVKEYAEFMGKDYNRLIAYRYKRERGLNKANQPIDRGWR